MAFYKIFGSVFRASLQFGLLALFINEEVYAQAVKDFLKVIYSGINRDGLV